MWKALNGALRVADFLAHRGMKGDIRCQICGHDGESVNHILFSCTLARQAWACSNIPHPKEGFDSISLFSNFHFLLGLSKQKKVSLEIRSMFP